MFKTSLLALVLVASAAHAQGTDTAAPAAPAGDAYQKGTLGFSFPITLLSNFTNELTGLTRAEPVPTVDMLYFLSDKAALDFIAGINLHYQQVIDPVTMMKSNTTVFGFAAGVGYRMYSHSGKLHKFIEPRGELFMGDTSRSPTFGFAAGFALGFERELVDWLALSGAVGGQVVVTNSFNDVQLVPVADLSAIFYFK
jgi:hypothetical protein